MKKFMKVVLILLFTACLVYTAEYLMVKDHSRKPPAPGIGQQGEPEKGPEMGGTVRGKTPADDSGYREDGSKPLKPFTSYGKSDTGVREKQDKKTDNSDKGLYLSVDEISFIAKNISLRDKLSALAIAQKINKGDADFIVQLARDGITGEEMQKIQEILHKNLSSGEVGKANEILLRNRKQYAAAK